jgi:hypothetical protein
MIHVQQFRELIIKPTLEHMGLYSRSAENLLVGTALVESRLEYLKQLRGGPALSVYQIEPTTHDDIWRSFLTFSPHLRDKTVELLSHRATMREDKCSDLVGNLPYSTAIARLVYYRIPRALPESTDIPGLAQYWKKHYNTYLGKGDPLSFVEIYETYAR